MRNPERLQDVDDRLIAFAYEVDKWMEPITIIEGHRPISKQRRLFSQGRTWFPNGANTRIVTYIDGVKKKGKHNYKPLSLIHI